MKQIHAMLMGGDGQAARQRLSSLIAYQPEKTTSAADVVVKILSTAYDQFCVEPVHDFCQDMELGLPAAVTERIHQALGARIARTREWMKTLRGVTRERLVRECRGLIVRNDVKGATLRAVSLLGRAAEEDADELCSYLARGMASLPRDHERSLLVIGLLLKGGGPTGRVASMLADRFNHLAREFGPGSFESGNKEWLALQTEAILSLRSFLPGPNEVGEPTPAQLDNYYEELHAILRAATPGRDREALIDALSILMEYCPTDPSPIRNLAGVEDRMFIRLGPRAKLTAVRAAGKLGEIGLLRQAVLNLARDCEQEDRLRLLTAVMGGLRHADFSPWLQAMLAKTSTRQEEEQVLEALGRIGSPEATALLLERLDQSMRRLADPVWEHRAYVLLTALGRVGRAKGLDPAWRNQLVRQVIRLTDVDDRKLAFQAANEMFSVRLDELQPEFKLWAASKAVEALWGQPPSSASGAAQAGWRQPMVSMLKRLGPAVLRVVLETAVKFSTRYGGAMSALAEALQEIGDERAVPLLADMTRCAFLYVEDPRQSKLLREHSLDAASGELRDLDRDEVIHTLLYTLDKVGGSKGVAVVLDYADQVQAGRIEPPGQQTINFLLNTRLKHGRLDKVERHEDAGEPEMDEREFKSALSDARGGLLTPKARRIAGIATLGQSRRLEAVEVLLVGLGDKDPLVASAAHTALAQFMQPLPREQAFCNIVDQLLERPALLKGRVLERLLEFIRREMPKNPPYDRLFAKQLEIGLDDGALIHQLRCAAARPASRAAAEESGSGPEGAVDGAANGAKSNGAELSELDKRRAYLQARRDWIAGGKVGTPPTPPA